MGRPNCSCDGDGISLFGYLLSDLRYVLEPYYAKSIPDMDWEYHVKKCRDCWTYWQVAVPSADLLRIVYSEWQQRGDPPGVDLHGRDANEIRTAQSHFGRTDLRTLDFSTAYAAWARTARALGCRSYGSDLDEACVEFARRHGVLADYDILDFVHAEQVVENLPDPLADLTRRAGHLVPGGIIKVSVPSTKNAALAIRLLQKGQATGDAILPILPLEHLNCYTRCGLGRLAARAGLRPVRPAIRDRYAFLGAGKPRLKEVVRPIWQWVSPGNIYVWLSKP